MKYFNNITSKEELKKKFREYCVTMHPDKGGNAEEFKKMVAEYETACKNIGAWTKGTADEVASIKRGTLVIYEGPGAIRTKYIILTVSSENIELLRIVSECKSLEDVEMYCDSDYEGTETHCTLTMLNHLRPISKKFGIGYYWDDIDGKIYTEQDILRYEHNAQTFDTWVNNWKADKAEKERIAKEEKNRRESAIIAEWSHYLEEIPAAYKSTPWNELQELPRAERKAREKAEKKEERRNDAQRTAAFKRNIKAVFHRYFPGVKVTVTNNSSYYDSSVLSWVDGPSVAEVEAVEAFDYFRGSYYQSAGMFEDYGCVCSRDELAAFRKKFGSWSDDKIKFVRSLSEEKEAEARETIADLFPDFEADRREKEDEHGKVRGCAWYSDINLTNEDDLRKVLGFYVRSFDWATATDEQKQADYQAKKPYYNRTSYYRKGQAGITLNYSQLLQMFTEYYKGEQTDTTTQETAQRAKSSETTVNTSTDTNKAAAAQDTTDEAPADGLELVEIADGVAVVGDSRTTYRNRKQIKAHGATWNKAAQQWQATDPEAVARLRQWFGVAESSPTDKQDEEETATTQATGSNEQPAEQPQAEEPTAQATPSDVQATAQATETLAAQGETVEEITDTDRASLSALSGLAFALRSVASSILSAFEDWKTDDFHAKNLRQSIAQDLEEIKKLNERIRTMSEELEAINERQEQRAGRTDVDASDEQATQQADTGSGKPDELEMLKAAAEDADKKDAQGDCVGSVLARLYALAAVGLSVRDLIAQVKPLSGIPADFLTTEHKMQCFDIKEQARHRAELFLQAVAVNALFGYITPDPAEAA